MSDKSSLELIPYAGMPWAFFELYDGETGNFVFLIVFLCAVLLFAKTILKSNFVIHAKALDDKARFEWRYHFIVGLGLLTLSMFSVLIVNIFKLW